MDQWIEIDITKENFYSSNIYEEEQKSNAKKNLIQTLVQRVCKYGQLDNQHQIARRTGAMQKDSAYEKDQNVYDQEDSFIDDEEIDKENNGMVIPETDPDDYHMCFCNNKDFPKQTEYRQRIAIIKKHSAESKNKSAKKKNKLKEKQDNNIKQQQQQQQQQQEQQQQDDQQNNTLQGLDIS